MLVHRAQVGESSLVVEIAVADEHAPGGCHELVVIQGVEVIAFFVTMAISRQAEFGNCLQKCRFLQLGQVRKCLRGLVLLSGFEPPTY